VTGFAKSYTISLSLSLSFKKKKSWPLGRVKSPLRCVQVLDDEMFSVQQPAEQNSVQPDKLTLKSRKCQLKYRFCCNSRNPYISRHTP